MCVGLSGLRIPVLVRIHSSLVSKNVESSALSSTLDGTALPVPIIFVFISASVPRFLFPGKCPAALTFSFFKILFRFFRFSF